MGGEKSYNLAKLLSNEMYRNGANVSNNKKNQLYKDYIGLIRKAAYKGNPEAQFELALYYENMNYLHMQSPDYNPEKCLHWYRKAAKQNNAEACLNLRFSS